MRAFRTVTYEGGGGELSADVFAPEEPSTRTAVVLFHGGGYRFGERAAVHARADLLATMGFVALTAQYRLLDEAPWPAQLDDGLAAFSYVADHAEALGIEASRVVVQGHSAGAHLALLVATRAPVAAVVCFYPTIGYHPEPPPPGLDGRGRPPAAEQAVDGTIASWRLLGDDLDGVRITEASPIRQVDGEFPPTLIFHGLSDTMVRPFSSTMLHDRLVALGVTSELHLYAGQHHEFDLAPSMLEVSTHEVASFLRRYVSDPQGFDAEARAHNPFAAAPS